MQSRCTKDSASLFIAGSRHENCVQSLNDCSKEMQVPLHKDDEVLLIAHLVSGSPCLFPGDLLSWAAQLPSATWATQRDGHKRHGNYMVPLPSGAPAEGRHDTQESCRLCLWWMQQEGDFNQWEYLLVKSVIYSASFPKPQNPFMSMTAPDFILLFCL